MNEFWERIKAFLRPKQIAPDIKDINYKALWAKGIKALILDIDDTLMPRESNEVTTQVFDWVAARREEGFKLCLASNSRHPLRVKYIGDTLGIPAISMGFKPLPFAFWRSLSILKTKPEETAMIGDQLFMDILGANILKIYSIFIDHKKEESFPPRQWMRMAEQWTLSKLVP